MKRTVGLVGLLAFGLVVLGGWVARAQAQEPLHAEARACLPDENPAEGRVCLMYYERGPGTELPKQRSSELVVGQTDGGPGLQVAGIHCEDADFHGDLLPRERNVFVTGPPAATFYALGPALVFNPQTGGPAVRDLGRTINETSYDLVCPVVIP